MEGYVVVETFLNEIDAELAQATLSAASIESFLKYEDTGHMMPVLQQAEGVKLFVLPENLEEAKAILTTASQDTEG